MKLKQSVIVKGLILTLLVFVLLFLQLKWDIGSYFSTERIRGWLQAAGPFAPLLYMAVMGAAVVVTPIPSLPLDIMAGAIFGPLLGTLYSALGALSGAVISFLIGRYLGREIVERFVGGHIHFCAQCSNRLLVKVVFISRLIPLVSFDIVSYGAGLTKISVGKFALVTFLGMLPLTFVYNTFGSVFVLGGVDQHRCRSCFCGSVPPPSLMGREVQFPFPEKVLRAR